MNDFNKLKEEIKTLYPDEILTNIELGEATERLIKFFAISAKAIHRAKRHEKLIKLHENRRN